MAAQIDVKQERGAMNLPDPRPGPEARALIEMGNRVKVDLEQMKAYTHEADEAQREDRQEALAEHRDMIRFYRRLAEIGKVGIQVVADKEAARAAAKRQAQAQQAQAQGAAPEAPKEQ